MSEPTTGIKLPKYKCHKEVWALKIREVFKNPNGSVDIHFEEKGYKSVNLEGDTAKKFSGEPDLGYYVLYEGGYVSWSPTKAFEEGYTLI